MRIPMFSRSSNLVVVWYSWLKCETSVAQRNANQGKLKYTSMNVDLSKNGNPHMLPRHRGIELYFKRRAVNSEDIDPQIVLLREILPRVAHNCSDSYVFVSRRRCCGEEEATCASSEFNMQIVFEGCHAEMLAYAITDDTSPQCLLIDGVLRNAWANHDA
eukprot:570072-Amphidinium_carterae.1